MDVVGAVMRELHLSAAGYRRLELGAPWAVSFSQAGTARHPYRLEGPLRGRLRSRAGTAA